MRGSFSFRSTDRNIFLPAFLDTVPILYHRNTRKEVPPHDLLQHPPGDTVTRRIEATYRKATGTVVYIHPEGRYYTVEFNLGLYKFRESFNT